MSTINLETAKAIARDVLDAPKSNSSAQVRSTDSAPSSKDNLSLKFIAYSNRKVTDTLQKLKEGIVEEERDPCFYIISEEGSGCVIISAEDEDNPVLGITDSDDYDLNNIPSPLIEMMESWRCSSIQIKSSAKVSRRSDLMTRGKGKPVFQRVIDPLIKTKWHQRSPYNYYCPVGYPTGCAAIAMSQVIRYYEWPKVGKGTHQYDDSSTPCWDFSYNKPDADSACPGLSVIDYDCEDSDSIKIDYENTRYDYFHMPWQLYNNMDGQTHLNDDEKWSAALVRHCATAVNMDFWKKGSHPDLGKGGGVGNQTYIMGLEALRDHFRYNAASEKHYYQSGWGKAVRNCLNEYRPVVFYSLNDMHIYLCDGYAYSNPNQDVIYHFNFGWGGSWDGYYSEKGVSPDDNNYNLTQYVCTNLRPNADYKILDVVFNLPDFVPLHYGPSFQNETVEPVIFPFGKTPAILGYDRVFRINNTSAKYGELTYRIDAIKCNGVETKITAGIDRYTIPSNQLYGTDKIEVLLMPNKSFMVKGVEYEAISYHEVKVIDITYPDPVIPEAIKYNGVDYEVVDIDFKSLINKGRNKTLTAIKASTITQLSKELAKFTKLNYADFSSVKTIPNAAFKGLTNLSFVALNSATWVGDHAFDGCSGLVRADLPSVTFINDYSFQGCSSLEILNFSNYFTVGVGAFKNCVKLSRFPFEAVPTIGEQAFLNCKGLEKVNSDNLIAIRNKAFGGCVKLKSVCAHNAGEVGDNAFDGCTELEEFQSDRLFKVGDSAFIGCKKLRSISMEALSSIGEYAFKNCKALSSIEIKRSSLIGQGAFYGCDNLSSFSISSFKDGYVPDQLLYGCRQLKKIFPSSLRLVGVESFVNCKITNDLSLGDVSSRAFYSAFTETSSPITITFEAYCKSLGDRAFYNGRAITSINSFASTPPTCGADVFKGVPSNIPVYVPAKSVQKYRTAEGWKQFSNIKSLSVVIDGVKYEVSSSDTAIVIGCDSDTVLKTSNHVCGILDDKDRNIIDKAFEQAITSRFGVTLPSCLVIKEYVTINGRRFKVSSIAEGAFKDTLNCLSIYLEELAIAAKALSGCTAFKAIVSNSYTPPAVSADSFHSSKISKNTLLIVPKGAINNYKKTAVWKKFEIIGFDSIINPDFEIKLPSGIIDQQIEKEALQWFIHDKYHEHFEELLGLISNHWRDIPKLLGNNSSLAKTASEIFSMVNNSSRGFELILPESINGRLNGTNANMTSIILKEGIKSLGKLQLFASGGNTLAIDNYIKTPNGLLADVIKQEKLEIKGLELKELEIKELDKPISVGKVKATRPIKPLKKRNVVLSRICPVNDYEEDLYFAAQRFSDLLYSELKPYHSSGDNKVFVSDRESAKQKKESVFVGLYLSEESALKEVNNRYSVNPAKK